MEVLLPQYLVEPRGGNSRQTLRCLEPDNVSTSGGSKHRLLAAKSVDEDVAAEFKTARKRSSAPRKSKPVVA